MAQTGIQRSDDGTVAITLLFSPGELESVLGSAEAGAETATPIEGDPAAAGVETTPPGEQPDPPAH